MAFGKRSAGTAPPLRMPQLDAAPSGDSLLSSGGVTAVRPPVSNPGEIDRKFIALAIGVVVLAAGAAIAAPSLASIFTGGVRPIEEVIAGLDRPAARNALALEAFPDADGKAFMTSLAANFPGEHGRLLDTLTDAAMAGGDRDALYLSMNGWAMNFVPGQMVNVGRTGARGFDEGIAILDDVLKVAEKEVGGCTGTKLQQAMMDPSLMERLQRYDGAAYHTGMRANRAFVDLAAAGRKTPAFSTQLTADDMSVVQSTFFQMLGDPQVMNIMQAASASRGGAGAQAQLLNSVNFCQLGRTLLVKMRGLPEGTKTRLFGTMMTQDISRYNAAAFSSPSGGLPLNLLSGR